jgi:hypothetical protein
MNAVDALTCQPFELNMSHDVVDLGFFFVCPTLLS